jgi:hypothetical protein
VAITVPLIAKCHCPVVDHAVILRQDRVFLDYILLSEAAPTCSNIHECLGKYGDVKNITECLLHACEKYLASGNGSESN